MPRFRPVVAVLAGSLSFVLLAAAPPAPRDSHDVSAAHAREVNRIHAHFDSVLTELDARDMGQLSVTQRANRRAVVSTLRGYNARGEFPHNYDFAEPMPYFVDRKTGTLCAVAFLLESTSRRDIVDRVAQANNNVRVSELAGDSAFDGWLATHGLTLEEAARIQVPYIGDGNNNVITPAQKTRNTAFLIAAPFAVGGAAVTSVWNALGNSDGHRRAVSVVGLTSGVVAAGLGTILIANSDLPGAARGIGAAGAALGGMSIGLSVRAMHRRSVVAATREADRDPRKRADLEASISPIVPLSANAGAGLAVAIRF